MKAEELMIGDWVAIRMNHSTKEYKEGDYLPHKVSSGLHLRNNEIDLISIENNQCGDGYGDDFCLPIPLTAEILENNGFKKFESKNYAPCYFIKGLTLQWHCYGKYFYIRSDDADIRITEVHELQHALRLCSLVELANNFKI